ncbi:Flp1 family type IVb pilin [Pilosibacter sp. HC1M1C21]
MRQLFSSIPGQVLDFIVVLIGLVIVFKTQINKLLTGIFTEINKQAKEVY